MRPIYETIPDDLEIYYRASRHFMPHMHDMVEIVYILYGTFEIGMDGELYHMEKGDIAILFPGKIHHAQCFGDPSTCASMYLMAAPSLTGNYAQRLSSLQPENPVIAADSVHPDTTYALRSLYHDYGVDEVGVRESNLVHLPIHPDRMTESREEEAQRIAKQSLVQLILARSIPLFRLMERPDESHTELEHQIITYMSAHYRENVTLTGMAKDLYVSPYRLSRTFSSVFHTNFNGFLNDMRLDYVCSVLQYSDRSITDISMDAGFESQRTFNRVFQEKMHMSPRDYRNKMTKSNIEKE